MLLADGYQGSFDRALFVTVLGEIPYRLIGTAIAFTMNLRKTP